MMVPIERDEDGELYFSLPDDIMDNLGWNQGDVIEWTKNEDGTWTLTKLT